MISVCTTFKALESVKANKATGHDNIPAWVLRNYETTIVSTEHVQHYAMIEHV